MLSTFRLKEFMPENFKKPDHCWLFWGKCNTDLIYISSRVVEDTQHRYEPVWGAVGAGDVRPGGPDAVDVKADAAGRFRDESRLLEGVVDALDRVVGHRQEEAAAERWSLLVLFRALSCWKQI